MPRLLLLIVLLTAFTRALASPFVFIKNHGQWQENVLYRTAIPAGQLWVTKSGLVYQLYNGKTHQKPTEATARKAFSSQIVTLDFKNQVSFSRKESEIEQHFNFMLGNNPKNWQNNVPAYKEIYLENVIEGIDFRMYGTDQTLKYEYIAKPGSDPSQIEFEYKGVNELFLENQELHLKTDFGIIKEFEPFTFQTNGNKKTVINSKFNLKNKKISFLIGNYDKTRDLIIDPELVFSSFSGALSDNWSHTATFDSKGNTYAAGTIFGVSFPVTLDALQEKAGGTTRTNDIGYRTDVVIIKYSSDGKTILYSTFLGGNESEVPHSIIVNSKDQLVVFGTTSSSNFPVTKGAIDETFNGGTFLNGPPITTNIGFFSGTDIFVSLISEDGKKLLGSTYVGGSENDGLHDYRALDIINYGDEFRGEVNVDSQDNIYVASVTTSANFPVVSAFQKKNSAYDAVIFKLSSNCNSLLFSTFLGGNNYDAAYGLRIDKTGAIYICGVTLSKDFPITNGAFKRSLGGDSEGFVVKIENQKITASTYLGTSKGDIANFIDLDIENNIYIFGLTTGEYPVTSGLYSNAKSGQFIQCLSNNLNSSKFSSVFGSGRQIGFVDIVPTAFMINNCGNIYVAGWGGKVNAENGYNKNSTTVGLPITNNAYRKTTTGSNYYFAIFEKGFKSLLYGTFFGSNAPANKDDERGDHLDGGTCRFDKKGVIYHSACVCKANGFVEFPLKNAIQPNHNNNNCNMAAFKFDLDGLNAAFNLKDGNILNPTTICAPAKLIFENKTDGGETYKWLVNNKIISISENINYNFTDSGKFEIKLIAYNKLTCKAVDSTVRNLIVKTFEHSVSKDTTVCPGAAVSFTATGGLSYNWQPSSFFKNGNSPKVSAVVDNTQVFTVEISNKECTIKKEVKANVENTNEDFVVTQNKTICKGNSITLSAFGFADKIVWSGPLMSDSLKANITVSPKTTSTYVVKAFFANGCKPSTAVKVSVDESVSLDFDYKYKYSCNKPTEIIFENNSKGAKSYSWNLINEPQTKNFDKIILKNDLATEIQLFGESINGCIFSIKKNVSLNAYDGIIPNVITPNNDKKNDTFVVGFPETKLLIYNNWGKKVFENAAYKNDWGNNMADGTYYYLLTLPDGQTCKGWLEVIN